MSKTPDLPLLAPVPATRLKEPRSRVRLRATAAEREKIAERLELPGVVFFVVDAQTAQVTATEIRLKTSARARVIRRCVVTLDTFEQSVDLPFLAAFSERASPPPLEGADDAPEAEEPEPIGPDGLQLGELAVQHLSLALEPYPRHPDAPARGHADWVESRDERLLASQLTRLTRAGDDS